MRTREALQKKASSHSRSAPAPNPLASRPFAPPPQPEAIAAPKLSYEETMVAIERAGRGGNSLSRMKLYPSDFEPPQPLQAKLQIGAPGDKYEREADRVASQVVGRLHAPGSQPQVMGEPVQRADMLKGDDELRMKPKIGPIQRVDLADEDDELMMKPLVQRQLGLGGMAASPNLEQSINRERGSRQPLADNIRQPMEQAFGAAFSGVRVHADRRSEQLSQALQAKAFTTGQDVFFRQGAYQPQHRSGQELIAHELTHVVQQNGREVKRSPLALQQHLKHPVATQIVKQKALAKNKLNVAGETVKHAQQKDSDKHLEQGVTSKTSSQPIQAKLTISRPSDKCEQEADQIARQAVTEINHSAESQVIQREITEEKRKSSGRRQSLKTHRETENKFNWTGMQKNFAMWDDNRIYYEFSDAGGHSERNLLVNMFLGGEQIQQGDEINITTERETCASCWNLLKRSHDEAENRGHGYDLNIRYFVDYIGNDEHREDLYNYYGGYEGWPKK